MLPAARLRTASGALALQGLKLLRSVCEEEMMGALTEALEALQDVLCESF